METFMQIPQNAVVAVVDGENFNLFKNHGDSANVKLKALDTPDVDDSKVSSGARHGSSSANPDQSQQQEDAFGHGVVDQLNQLVLDGTIQKLIIVAAPRTLGELRKGYHKELEQVLVGEIDKVLTGHSIQDIEKSIEAAE
jgi:protein required for attachment to host cells